MAAEICPLFAVSPAPWSPPDPARYDALLLTSANAARLAGPGLRALADLPTLAVGEATAAAAWKAGLRIAAIGDADAAALVARARRARFARLLHLAGRERVVLAGVDQLTVYASEPLPVAADQVRRWVGRLALLHSPRAACRFAALVDEHGVDRTEIGLAALSPAVLDAAGNGWAMVAASATPADAALTRLARELIDQPWRRADKRGS